MKKLDDIPKNNIYQVPESYFDELPAVIQARVQHREKTFPFLYYTVRYALPVLLMAVALIVWWGRLPVRPGEAAEEILASVNTASLVNYLEETELTTDQLLESVHLSPHDIDQIEDEVYDLGIRDDEELLNELLDTYDYEMIN